MVQTNGNDELLARLAAVEQENRLLRERLDTADRMRRRTRRLLAIGLLVGFAHIVVSQFVVLPWQRTVRCERIIADRFEVRGRDGRSGAMDGGALFGLLPPDPRPAAVLGWCPETRSEVPDISYGNCAELYVRLPENDSEKLDGPERWLPRISLFPVKPGLIWERGLK